MQATYPPAPRAIPPRHYAAKGFSLLELVLVLVLLTLFSGIGAASLWPMAKAQTLPRHADDLLSLVLQCQSEAVRNGATVELLVDLDAASAHGAFVDAGGARRPMAGSAALPLALCDPNQKCAVRITGADGSVQEHGLVAFAFDPNGKSDGASVKISLVAAPEAECVVLPGGLMPPARRRERVTGKEGSP